MAYLDELFAGSSADVWEISAIDLKAGLDAGEQIVLVDVREPWEWHSGHLNGAVHIPLNSLPQHLSGLDREGQIVVYCHLGHRSWYATAFLRQQGYAHVASLAGGIDAWDYLNWQIQQQAGARRK